MDRDQKSNGEGSEQSHERAFLLVAGLLVLVVHGQLQRSLLLHGQELLEELGDIVVVLGARLDESAAPTRRQLFARLRGDFTALKRTFKL